LLRHRDGGDRRDPARLDAHEADALRRHSIFDLLGSFGRRNEVARNLTDEIEKPLTGFYLGG
jgi:hypothetical protein